MGKTTTFLWRLFRKATEEQTAEPKFKVRQGLTKKAYYKTTIRLPADLVKAYKHAAVERNVSFSYLIEEALQYYLENVMRE